MVKTTPNAQHCPSPALGGLFWYRRARCEAVPAAGNTPNYPKLPQGLLGGARCCSITALYFFNFPPLGSGVSHEQRARGERCPRPRGARRRARSQLWQPLFGTRQSPRRHRREVSEQPPREDLFFWGGFRAGAVRIWLRRTAPAGFLAPRGCSWVILIEIPRGERGSACRDPRGAQRIAAWEGWKKPRGGAVAGGDPSPAFVAASPPLLLPWEAVLGSARAGKGLS